MSQWKSCFIYLFIFSVGQPRTDNCLQFWITGKSAWFPNPRVCKYYDSIFNLFWLARECSQNGEGFFFYEILPSVPLDVAQVSGAGLCIYSSGSLGNRLLNSSVSVSCSVGLFFVLLCTSKWEPFLQYIVTSRTPPSFMGSLAISVCC